MASPVTALEDGIVIAVRLTPKAGGDGIKGLYEDASGKVWLAARVAAPPEDGKANAALLGLIAKRLGIARGQLEMLSGATARTKMLKVTGNPVELMAAAQILMT